ncbi:hypothetical protein CEXT_298371, partial [Caerostris extrusa]
ALLCWRRYSTITTLIQQYVDLNSLIMDRKIVVRVVSSYLYQFNYTSCEFWHSSPTLQPLTRCSELVTDLKKTLIYMLTAHITG